MISACKTAAALVVVSVACGARAQVFGGAPTAQTLLSTQFRTPLGYEAALEKLDQYYQEQVGRKLAAAFPEIGPKQHYEVWHDIWVEFEPAGDQTQITMKRPADSITSRLIKSWMLGFAGRLNAEIPLTYQESTPMRTAETDLYGTPRDVASILRAQPGFKALASWQHPGLVVSASPMVSVVMDAAGSHGVHHLTVTADSVAAARQVLTTVMRGAQKPCICAAYSETSELDVEILAEVQNRANVLGPNAAGSVYVPGLTAKHIEDRVRADPEMQKRITQAAGAYDVKFRIDKPYRQVTVTWIELQGYSRDTGKFSAERHAGSSQVANPRIPPQSGAQLNARTKMEPLPPGAYRIRLEGSAAAGQSVLIDERVYWFDGKSFEEL
jgi:hypothetical protein